MLLKLIKYDFREQFREHIGLYALVFVSALTEIILDSFEFDLVSVFFWVLHSLSVIAMLICSLVIIVLYFRRNLLKDEGYLMNTLPVAPWMLYVSKFLTAFVLFILDLIVAVLTFSIMNHGFAWIKDIIGSMSDEFANSGFTMSPVVMFGSIAVIALLYTISILFFSLTTGYRANGSKDANSVLTFIILYVIGQVANIIVMIFTFFIPLSSKGSITYILTVLNPQEITGLMNRVVIGALAVSLLLFPLSLLCIALMLFTVFKTTFKALLLSELLSYFVIALLYQIIGIICAQLPINIDPSSPSFSLVRSIIIFLLSLSFSKYSNSRQSLKNRLTFSYLAFFTIVIIIDGTVVIAIGNFLFSQMNIVNVSFAFIIYTLLVLGILIQIILLIHMIKSRDLHKEKPLQNKI